MNSQQPKNIFDLYAGLLKDFGVQDQGDVLADLKKDWPAFNRYIINIAKLKADHLAFDRFCKSLKKILGDPKDFNINQYLNEIDQDEKPESRTSKIVNIMKEVNRPLNARAIKTIYLNTTEEKGTPQTITRNVQSTLASLKQQGRVKVNDGLYSLVDKDNIELEKRTEQAKKDFSSIP